ncbi:hypothetical protein E0H75_40435 [Kribbella capetownensis]|uniref:NADP-dependent oxidoreductase domain-containing protein n=1 Tax=Kribbella capetownensis TaxID=1572659 RepID=A0A4R0IWZ0_9ACTN|nr:hypothetical protein E0H75_40435 [Kribbella capetownensis]
MTERAGRRDRSDPRSITSGPQASSPGRVVEVVRAIAVERGLSPAQLALAWLLGKRAHTSTEDRWFP